MALKLRTTKNVDRNKFVQTFVNKDKLTPILEKEIAKGEFAWEYKFKGKEGDDAWHPSSHCTPSIHELWQIATSPPEERKLSSSLLKTFQVGQFWHQYLQEVALRSGVVVPMAIECVATRIWAEDNTYGPIPSAKLATPKAFHWVSGAGDLAPATIPVHGEYLVDFKTMRGGDFNQPGLPNRFAAKYECQINIYMELFNLDKALIIGIQKDSPHDLKEIEYERNQPLIDAIFEKWRAVGEFLDEGVEPDPDDDILLPLQGPIER